MSDGRESASELAAYKFKVESGARAVWAAGLLARLTAYNDERGGAAVRLTSGGPCEADIFSARFPSLRCRIASCAYNGGWGERWPAKLEGTRPASRPSRREDDFAARSPLGYLR